jgi:hypothetical protein
MAPKISKYIGKMVPGHNFVVPRQMRPFHFMTMETPELWPQADELSFDPDRFRGADCVRLRPPHAFRGHPDLSHRGAPSPGENSWQLNSLRC